MDTKIANLILLIGIFTNFSCNSDQNKNAESSNSVDNDVAAVTLESTGHKLDVYGKYIPKDDISIIGKSNKKGQPFVNEELPKSYTQRLFLKKIAASSYDVFLVPGYIVKYDTATKDYERKTLVALIKNNKLPITEIVQDGILYSNKINKDASFNGSFVIASASVSDKQMMELVVQDVTKSYVPDSLVDIKNVKKIISQIPVDQRKYFYYVKNAILTLVNNRRFTESTLSAKVNTTYITAGGKVYNCNDKFSRERVVAVELVSLDNLLTTNQ
jgi:hypothetical protein